MISGSARGARARNRRHKAIAPALDVGDIPVSEFAILKRLSDGSDVYAEVSLLDDDVGPGVIDELLFCCDLAGASDEIEQNIERTPAEGKHEPVAPEDSLTARKLERAKRDCLLSGRTPLALHSLSSHQAPLDSSPH